MLPDYGREVISSILPVLIVFLLFQLISRRYHKNQMIKMLMGFLYTIIGLILFLTGVNVGFAPVGSLLGSNLAAQTWRFVLIPIGALIGYYIVKAEPAVQVLNKQVEDVTNGSISRSAMNLCLSIGVSASVALALLRVLTGLNIYWLLIPGYIIALVLTRFVPKVFVGIAFDSGGVASGPMTSPFLLDEHVQREYVIEDVLLDVIDIGAAIGKRRGDGRNGTVNCHSDHGRTVSAEA